MDATDLRRVAGQLENAGVLDAPAGALVGIARRALPEGAGRELLSGAWLGHPLHPLLTDLPIGFWTSAWVLDLVGGRKGRAAAQRLIALGILSALPTAASGLNDWSETEGAPRRVGLVHAIANSAALVAYVFSWRARRRGRYLVGVAWGMAGAGAATVGGWLGGHLVYVLGTGTETDDAAPPA